MQLRVFAPGASTSVKTFGCREMCADHIVAEFCGSNSYTPNKIQTTLEQNVVGAVTIQRQITGDNSGALSGWIDELRALLPSVKIEHDAVFNGLSYVATVTLTGRFQDVYLAFWWASLMMRMASYGNVPTVPFEQIQTDRPGLSGLGAVSGKYTLDAWRGMCAGTYFPNTDDMILYGARGISRQYSVDLTDKKGKQGAV